MELRQRNPPGVPFRGNVTLAAPSNSIIVRRPLRGTLARKAKPALDEVVEDHLHYLVAGYGCPGKEGSPQEPIEPDLLDANTKWWKDDVLTASFANISIATLQFRLLSEGSMGNAAYNASNVRLVSAGRTAHARRNTSRTRESSAASFNVARGCCVSVALVSQFRDGEHP